MKSYVAGEAVSSIARLDFALRNGLLLYVKNWDKTAHPIILANMQYRTLKRFIDNGQVFLACKITKEE